MTRWTGVIVVLCALCPIPQAAGNEPGEISFESYKSIFEKNIFSRSRISSAGPAGVSGPVRTEKVVLSLYVLRGVAIETSSRLAFVEEEISGQFSRLAVGDALLNGTIAEIASDRVVFKADEQTREVRIGQEFDRVESVVERSADAAVTSADPNVPVPARAVPNTSLPASPSGESDILKQMMERRNKELGS
jgi:hypothetical protein